MKRWIATVAALLALIATVWVLREPGGANEPPAGEAPGNPADSARARADSGRGDGGDKSVAAVQTKRKVSAAERKAVHKRIVERLAQRAIEQRDQHHQPAPQTPAPPPTPETESGSPHTIKDRTGGELATFVGTVNEDFLPLADECYADALRETPDLAGMLELNVSIIADEEIGGMVETADLGPDNEIDNASMTECIRETMLSTIFPPVDESGRQSVRLTLMFAPDEPQ